MKTQRAFSLLQIMIVIGIIGILVSLMLPNYQDSVVRSRRTDGQSALFYMATQMERAYFDSSSYSTIKEAKSPEGWYQLEIREQNDEHYLIAAVPTGAQGKRDTQCQTLTIDEKGHLGVVDGPAGKPKEVAQGCWS